MADTKQFIELDPKDFKLSDYDNVRIDMPAKPELSEEDVDAQLFEYVASGGKKIQGIADLDDEWVKANFEGLETIEDVRRAIKDQYDHDLEFEYSDIKFKNCADALLARLQGNVDEATLANNIEVMREGNAKRLEEMHISFEQFLREEHMTPDQYDAKLADETSRQMRMNVALDIMADVLNAQVGNHEICDYLSAPDPEKFLAEIREKGQVEAARRAAVRVKVMRRIVETAIVREVDEDGKPVIVAPPQAQVEEPEEDVEVPDFENMPEPQIRED